MAYTFLSICSGVAGLELGIKTAVDDSRVLGYIERDAFAASVLLARMEDASLEPAPIYCGDIEKCDFTPFAGQVDCIVAGFPCQPFSVAGAKRGIEDERFIFDHITRAICETGCQRVFLENVPGLLTSGLGYVLRKLAEVGFHATWGSLRASEVGASHRRERVFIMADAAIKREREPDDTERTKSRQNARKDFSRRSGIMADAASCKPREPARGDRRKSSIRAGQNMADADRRRPEGKRFKEERNDADGCNKAMADTVGERPQRKLAGRTETRPTERSDRANSHLFAPGPRDAAWKSIIEDDPTLEPALCRVAHGMAHRVDRLRAIGNGVCSLQAAVAWSVLENRLRSFGG